MLSPERKRGAGKVVIKQGKMQLTSEISEINRLSVGIQKLNHRVVAVLDTAADGGDVSLHHCHIFCNQILTITLKRAQRWNSKMRNYVSKFRSGTKSATARPALLQNVPSSTTHGPLCQRDLGFLTDQPSWGRTCLFCRGHLGQAVEEYQPKNP